MPKHQHEKEHNPPHKRRKKKKKFLLQYYYVPLPLFRKSKWLGKEGWEVWGRYENLRDAMQAIKHNHRFSWRYDKSRILDPDGEVVFEETFKKKEKEKQ